MISKDSRETRLPPLNTLKAFEASARLLSFKKAAEELHLTSSAVSHQIKQLEDSLGDNLFIRQHRCIEMTESGEKLYKAVVDSFAVLHEVSTEIKASASKIRIKFLVGKAKYFISPLVDEYLQKHSDVTIDLEYVSEAESGKVVDYDNREFDIALLWGDGFWKGIEKPVKLFCSMVGIYCSPGIVKHDTPFVDLSVLEEYPLIHDSMYPLSWNWLNDIVGEEKIRAKSNNIFISGIDERIKVALDGMGVMMIDRHLIQQYIERGELVCLSEKHIDGYPYYLALRDRKGMSCELEKFSTWLLERLEVREVFNKL